tara:strand:+ start:134 stop:409 length:276 start_codon:yes stop_codon:yes gene_type:complete
MKLTLVIDTDDIEGIKDAFKVASHFYNKYTHEAHLSRGKIRYGKIKHIKMLRKFARAAVERHKAGADPSGLRYTKEYTEELFALDPDILGN